MARRRRDDDDERGLHESPIRLAGIVLVGGAGLAAVFAVSWWLSTALTPG
jgi:hypothetical protein